MSDSEDSMVTYTAVSSPFRGLSDIGSPGVDGLPVMPEDPYAYVVPAYPEFMPPEEEVLPAKEQPLPAVLSPTANSSGYVPKSDPEEDPEEDDDEDLEEDPADYLTDGGDDVDDEDESSDDDEDDDVDIEDDEEEEEHLAPAESTVVALPAVDHAPYAQETEPFKTDESAATPPPHPAYRVTARISIRDEPPTPFWSDTEVARLLAIPTPPPSLLSPWSSPLPQIPSPPFPQTISTTSNHTLTDHLYDMTSLIVLNATIIRDTNPPLPIQPQHSSPTLYTSTNRREDRPEVTLPPRKRLGIALGPRYEVGESSSAVAARPITNTWNEMLEDMPTAQATDDTELGQQMTEFATRVRQYTNKIYTRLDDKQTERQLMAGQLNMLYKDRRAHARIEVMSLRTTVLGQQAVITELHAADHRRQATIIELLAADHRRHA
ncbi:hypothetical protein Tco_0663066 [Tanacetum coccineum]